LAAARSTPPLHARIMISRTVLLAICLLSTGCTIPLFKHPLESPDVATVPTQLFGVYKQVGGPDNLAHHVHVGPAGADAPAGVFRFVSISQPRDTVTPLKATQGYGIATRMGDVLVLQIPVYSSTDQSNGAQLDCEKWDESAILGYIFMRVRIEANRIEMSQVDDHFVASAIENGKLCGSVERREKTYTVQMKDDGERGNTTIHESKTEAVTVTETPGLLRPFIQANMESGLFSDTVTTFERND